MKVFMLFLLGSAWNEALKYQLVLNEPLKKEHENKDNIIYSPLYNDFSNGGTGLGLIITIAVCVIANASYNNELIGVAGVDIRLKTLQQQSPQQQLGPFGHSFVINNNGVILVHKYLEGAILENPATIYLEDLEHSSDVYSLKKFMIDRDEGCLNTTAKFIYPQTTEARLTTFKSTYCFQSVGNTPYSAGISITEANQFELNLSKLVPLEDFYNTGLRGISSNSSSIKTEIAPWLFCDFPSAEQSSNPASELFYPTGIELAKYLQGSKNISKCDMVLLRTLIFSSALVYNHTTKHWKEKLKNISSRYIITKNGVFSIEAEKQNSKTFLRDIFSEEVLLHSEIVSNAELTFTVPTKMLNKRPKQNGNNTLQVEVDVTKAIKVGDQSYIAGIVGFSILSSHLSSLIISIIQKYSGNESEKFNFTEDAHCYLVDENAYVVASNQGNHQVGVFLGIIHGHLLEKFTEENIYETIYVNDTLGLCNETEFTHESDSQILRPFYHGFLNTFGEIHSYFLTIFYLLLQCILVSIKTEDTYRKVERICTKEKVFYKRSNRHHFYLGNLQYSEYCYQSFAIISINKTNLDLLVLAKNEKPGCVDNYIVSNEPVKIANSNICEHGMKYRKAMPFCYQQKPNYPSSSELTRCSKTLEIVLLLAFCTIKFLEIYFQPFL